MLLESLSDEFAFFPFKHAMGALLVLFVQSCLFHDHFLEQVLLRFENQNFSQPLLVLLDAEPLLMADLVLSDLLFVHLMHVKYTFVDNPELRLCGILLKVNVKLLWIVIAILMIDTMGIKIGLGRLV